MSYWFIAGILILIWVTYDVATGTVWIHRRVVRQYEPILFWTSITCYTLLGVLCLL